jgi:cellulose biosynthesis protein BcsQ
MKILASYNIKGGVGKTTAAVHLAHLAAREGRRTLLWDLDPQGAATYVFRVKARVKGGGRALVRGSTALERAVKGSDYDNLDVLPADFTYRNLDLLLDATKKPTRRLARLLEPLADEYDLVLLDCPPGISLLSENVMRAADTLLVPLIPATLSLRTFDQLVDFVADLDAPRPAVLAFYSMVDRRKKSHRELVDDSDGNRADLAAAAVPSLSIIEQLAARRAPVTDFAPTSNAARSYERLWAELVARGAVG